MGNIFTTENVAKYNTRSYSSGVGEYVLRNGVWAMDIRPAPFYKNYGEESYILRNEFAPNTQYIIDLWIDGDDTIYNGNNVACGLTLYYTDGTYNSTAVITGGSGIGFQHRVFVTDASKSVRDFNVYYYTSTPVYYRADSYVVPLTNNTNVTKNGILTSGDFTERAVATYPTKLGNGYVLANELIEI